MRRSSRHVPRWRAGSAPALAATIAGLLAVAAGLTFAPLLHNGFVNWDDPAVIVDNPHLVRSGLVGWAFATTLIGHYQPLSWLAWGAVARAFSVTPAPFHAMSLALHIVNGALVYAFATLCLERAAVRARRAQLASAAGALLFLVHPVVVEPVAWASAFPYVLSTTALLIASIAYVTRRRGVAVALYGVSLLARATALGFPVVLLALDVYPLRRHRPPTNGAKRKPDAGVAWRTLVLEKTPFAALAIVAAFIEWRARDVASVAEVGITPRLGLAAAAPFVYMRRLAWPVRLSPLDVIPIVPRFDLIPFLAAVGGLVAVSAIVWRLRRITAAPAVVWIVYLALLAPIAGLTPSGVQATADRYLYVPMILAAIVAAAVFAPYLTNGVGGTAAAAISAAVVITLASIAHAQTACWRDSLTLWTRAAELDPRNDIATYNLAVALAEAGRDEEAIARYEETLALVPDHDLARQQLAKLKASRLERDADALAAAGRLDDAAAEYGRALALDGTRLHARTARGMALTQRGRLREGAADLRAAIDAGATDVEAANALAYALAQEGDAAGAAAVLDRLVAAHPDDVNAKHNLARLLATTSDERVRNATRAVALAQEVCARTANRDPRALDTLAAAYAAAGNLDAARTTAAQAIARAREVGDSDLAVAIGAHTAVWKHGQPPNAPRPHGKPKE